jgi:dolichol-phosphate mannosyltransferase
VEMDADFSHEPGDLLRLLNAARDADLVLGSRYVEGGGVANWSIARRWLSAGGCWYARTVLGLRQRDLTGGFKCFRREVLEAIDLEAITTRGYAFQVELTYRAIRNGFQVVEVPILFRERRVGKSKMGPSIMVEAVWRLPILRFGKGGAEKSPFKTGRRYTF